MAKSLGTFARITHWFKTSVWAFPLVLLLIMAVLVLGKVHGSSIGVYTEHFYGDQAEDPHLLYGEPQPIRSDEWLIWTQLTLAQEQAGFPAFNENLGSGRDMSIVPPAPFLDWLTVFRPQTWSFFGMPLNLAFSFQWWMMPFLLIVSSYFFFLRILSGKKLLSIILSLSFALSPFIVWWWQVGVFLPLAYAFFIMILAMRVINQEKIWRIKSGLLNNLIYVLGLGYLGACLILVLYAPFIIPIAIATAVFIIGYLLNKLNDKKNHFKTIAKRAAIFLPALILIGLIGAAFFIDRHEMIQRVSDSVYPGQRLSDSGGLSSLYVTDGFLMPLLQEEPGGMSYYSNQSTASNFILLLPFLMVPAILLQLYEYKKHRRVDWPLVAVNACALLFFARVFIPFGDGFYKLLLLDRVPNKRLLIGLGFLGIIQLVLFIARLQKLDINFRKLFKFALVYGLICLLILFNVGLAVMRDYPLFLNDYGVLIGWSLFFTAILVAFISNKPLIGSILLFVFSILSINNVHPLYRKLDVLAGSEIVHSIREVSAPDEDWITVDSVIYENLPAAAGRGLANGVQIYADTNYWNQIDGGKYEDVYNRQAHAVFISSTHTDQPEDPIELIATSYFHIQFSCSDFVHKNADFVLAPHAIDYECLRLVKNVPYPAVNFHIYEVISP